MRTKRINFIAMDMHSGFCEGGWIDDRGTERGSFKTPTAIPELVEAIERVPRPRRLVIEEGPLSDWLCRNLTEHVEEMISCDPYRNALISRDGEKSDALDWRKLAQLYRGGYIKAVHHAQEFSRSQVKQHVQLYHDRVRRRVSEAQKIIWRARRMGVFILEKHVRDEQLRRRMIQLAKLAAASDDNPFADQCQRWIDDGCSPRVARRNLARSLAAVMWGMWKSGSDYDSSRVGSELQHMS